MLFINIDWITLDTIYNFALLLIEFLRSLTALNLPLRLHAAPGDLWYINPTNISLLLSLHHSVDTLTTNKVSHVPKPFLNLDYVTYLLKHITSWHFLYMRLWIIFRKVLEYGTSSLLCSNHCSECSLFGKVTKVDLSLSYGI